MSGKVKTCPVCEKDFSIPKGRGHGHRRYCSDVCRGRSAGIERRKAILAEGAHCVWCEGWYAYPPDRGRRRKYCGQECRGAARAYRNSRKTKPPCGVDGCPNPARGYSADLCEMHYGRVRRYGHLDPGGCPRCGAPSGSARNGAFCSRDCSLMAQKYRRYGLTIAEGLELEAKSGGRCAICEEPARGSALSWDHCHKSGELRGLLCNLCNAGIGMLRDDPKILRAAIRYLS